MQVFIDTAYFYAKLDARDQWHGRAQEAAVPERQGVTSSLVVNETFTLFQTRGQFSIALEFLEEVREDPDVRIVYVDAVLQSNAWDECRKWGASGASVVDCTCFAIMRSMGIRKAFTFDEHFRAAGFEILG